MRNLIGEKSYSNRLYFQSQQSPLAIKKHIAAINKTPLLLSAIAAATTATATQPKFASTTRSINFSVTTTGQLTT